MVKLGALGGEDFSHHKKHTKMSHKLDNFAHMALLVVGGGL